MEKVSEIISKKVVSIEEGIFVGYVLNVVFDTQIKNFMGVVVSDNETEREFFLSCDKIQILNNDIVMIASKDDLSFFSDENNNNPIGKMVLDFKGVCLGKVCDVFVQGNKVKKILTDKCEILQKNIYSCGVDYLIFGNKKKQLKFDIENNQFKRFNSFDSVKITGENKSNKNITIQSNIPQKIFIDEKYLIGKIVDHDIIGYNNEIICKKGDIVNKKIVDKSKKHNKLNILIYYCR